MGIYEANEEEEEKNQRKTNGQNKKNERMASPMNDLNGFEVAQNGAA